MYTFDDLYNSYKNYYIRKNGQAKFNTVQEKILRSNKMAQINGLSIRDKIAPTRVDVSSYIHEIPYFIFAGVETVAMAEFVAIKNWNEEINTIYNLCTDHELFFKGEAILKGWKIRI